MRYRRLSLICLPLVFGLTGCDLDEVGNWGTMDRFREEFRFTYQLRPGGTLAIENINGSVEISAWEKNEVSLSGAKYAATEEMLRELKIEADSQPDRLIIRTVKPSGERCNCGAKYVLRVPKRINLNSISSSNGSLRIDDIEGEARLRTSNGSIKLNRHVGDVWATTSNAGIDALGLAGNLEARTSNGSIRADGLRGAFLGITSNASISARIEKLAEGRVLRAESSNGSIDLALPDWKDQALELSTSNASLSVRLPANANADVRARTSNARVNCDFELSSKSEDEKNRLEGKIGRGGALLRLHTSNGGIHLQKL